MAKLAEQLSDKMARTAISPLSASVYSWGGEGALLGGGGEDGTFGAHLGAGLKYRSMPEG